MKKCLLTALLLPLVVAPATAEAGAEPECVRIWTRALGGPDLPGPYGAHLRNLRETYNMFGGKPQEFIAYQCNYDITLTRLIILDEIEKLRGPLLR